MNLLLTSAGKAVCLLRYFKKALEGSGDLHAASNKERSPAFIYADQSVVTPDPYDKEYIPFLLDYCIENHIGGIVPFSDTELLHLAKNKSLFEKNGVRAVVSDEEIISVLCDKWETYRFCLKNNIRVPNTYLSVENALSDIKKSVVSYPLIVKPRWGYGSLYVFEADDEEELKIFFNKIHKCIMSSELRHEAGATDDNVLIQEKLKGQEYGMDVINDLGSNYMNSIIKVKYSMRSGSTEFGEVVGNAALKKFGAYLSETIGHIGNLDVDLIMEGDRPYLLEMNPRFGGGYFFSHLAGADLPLAIVKWLKNEPVPPDFFKEKCGVVSHKFIDIVKVDSPQE